MFSSFIASQSFFLDERAIDCWDIDHVSNLLGFLPPTPMFHEQNIFVILHIKSLAFPRYPHLVFTISKRITIDDCLFSSTKFVVRLFGL